MKEIELRRHAEREKDRDALSAEGRAQAARVGNEVASAYAVVFVSPARRTAETAAWFLRVSGQPLPDHAVIRGLASEQEDRWRAAARQAKSSRLDAIMSRDPALVSEESARLADVVHGLFDRVPEGGRALAVGHSPLIEAAVYGLTAMVVEPLADCEGINLTLDDQGDYRLEELRLSS